MELLSGAPGGRRITVGADLGYDTKGLIGQCRQLKVTPHVARKKRSAIHGRTTRHKGYRLSQGGAQTGGGGLWQSRDGSWGRKLRYCELARNRMWTELTLAGYNLVRLARLAA